MSQIAKLERCPMCDTPAAKAGRVLHTTAVIVTCFLFTMIGVTAGSGLLWIAVEILRSIWR